MMRYSHSVPTNTPLDANLHYFLNDRSIVWPQEFFVSAECKFYGQRINLTNLSSVEFLEATILEKRGSPYESLTAGSPGAMSHSVQLHVHVIFN
jgi:hypothetical protein